MSSFHPRSSWPQASDRKLAPPGSSFIDEPSQMTVVVLENVSMVFHQPFETSDDELSKYDYSVDAPSCLCEKSAPLRLSSSDYAANHNISRYFTRAETSDEQQEEEKRDDAPTEETSPANTPDLGSERDEDNILGSLPVLLPKAKVHPEKSLVRRDVDKTYADKLLGIDHQHHHDLDSTCKTTSMDSSSSTIEYESPVQQKKKRWFKFGGKNNKQGKNKRHNPFRRSKKQQPVTPKSMPPAAPRRAPLKRSVSELRRASF